MKDIRLIGKRIFNDINQYKWGLLLFLCYYVLVKKIFHAYCPVVIITGFPCPACGLTRAFTFFLTGQFQRAFHMHPLILFYVLFGFYIFIRRYIQGKKIFHIKKWVVALLLSMIITYGIRMLLYFPGYPPISYTHHNLLEKYSEFYNIIMYRLFGV